MAFFNQAITVLQTLVIALGAGLGIWGVINLLEGYGNDNPGAKSQGMKQLMAGAGVLDIGTGSGILAIAALKLGAREAEGVDIDPMCVRTAGENAERNGVSDRFRVLVGDLSDKASGRYDLITANIVASAILSLAPHVPALMAPGAQFIASGIIDERKEEVLDGLRAAGLTAVEVQEKRGWVCIRCEQKDV